MAEQKERLFNFPPELEKFIRVRAANEMAHPKSKDLNLGAVPQVPDGTGINGVELAAVNNILNDSELPDLLKRQVIGNFKIASKYQVLQNLVLSPTSKLRKNYLSTAVAIARTVTENDRMLMQLIKKKGY